MEKFDSKLEEKVRLFLQEAKQITEEENLEFGEDDLPELGQGPISSETISSMANRLNQVLEKPSEDPDSAPKQAKKLVKIHRP